MKQKIVWMSALALAVAATTGVQALAGVVLISTRYQQDTGDGNTEYYTDEKGPGMSTPGDAAMGAALGDYGYSFRLVLDRLLGALSANYGQDPATFLVTANPDMAPMLAIMSGSGASNDTPPPPAGVPVMMGEHVCLGNNAAKPGSLFLYNGTSSSDPNSGSSPLPSLYMKVIAPDHAIMKGFPLDAQGRVKIFRSPYPEEDLHIPTGGNKNYEFRWCTQVVADAAAGTTVWACWTGTKRGRALPWPMWAACWPMTRQPPSASCTCSLTRTARAVRVVCSMP